MFELFLIVLLLAALPVVYARGKRAGFERHTCLWVPETADRAPARFVAVACRTCGEDIPCALLVRETVDQGRPVVTATVDVTDLEQHSLTHADGSRPKAA
jgi:hypothetical protein